MDTNNATMDMPHNGKMDMKNPENGERYPNEADAFNLLLLKSSDNHQVEVSTFHTEAYGSRTEKEEKDVKSSFDVGAASQSVEDFAKSISSSFNNNEDLHKSPQKLEDGDLTKKESSNAKKRWKKALIAVVFTNRLLRCNAQARFNAKKMWKKALNAVIFTNRLRFRFYNNDTYMKLKRIANDVNTIGNADDTMVANKASTTTTPKSTSKIIATTATTATPEREGNASSSATPTETATHIVSETTVSEITSTDLPNGSSSFSKEEDSIIMNTYNDNVPSNNKCNDANKVKQEEAMQATPKETRSSIDIKENTDQIQMKEEPDSNNISKLLNYENNPAIIVEKVPSSAIMNMNDDEIEPHKSSIPTKALPPLLSMSAHEIEKLKEISSTVQKLKLKIYIEGMKVHQQSNNHQQKQQQNHHSSLYAEQMFADYWNAFGQFVSGKSTPLFSSVHVSSCFHPTNHRRSDIESMLNQFLITKSLRKKHNAMVKTMMRQCLHGQIFLNSNVGTLNNIPTTWKKRIRKVNTKNPLKGKIITKDYSKSSSCNKNKIGEEQQEGSQQTQMVNDMLQSFTENATHSHSTSKTSNNIIARTQRQNNNGIINQSSQARLPGMMEVEHISRTVLSNADFSLSTSSLWLVTVAVRDFLSTLLENAMETAANRETVSQFEAGLNINNKRRRINALDLVKAFDKSPPSSVLHSSSSRIAWERSVASIDPNVLANNTDSNLNESINEIINLLFMPCLKKKKVEAVPRRSTGKGKNLAAMVVRRQMSTLIIGNDAASEDSSAPPSNIWMENNLEASKHSIGDNTLQQNITESSKYSDPTSTQVTNKLDSSQKNGDLSKVNEGSSRPPSTLYPEGDPKPSKANDPVDENSLC
jgi:hypothetical protein